MNKASLLMNHHRIILHFSQSAFDLIKMRKALSTNINSPAAQPQTLEERYNKHTF